MHNANSCTTQSQGKIYLGRRKNNHLLFIDELKLCGKSENQIKGLVFTVEVFSLNIGTESGIKKYGAVIVNRGKVQSTHRIELPSCEKRDRYKYLGILEYERVKEQVMKDKFRNEYFRKTRLKSKLNGRNKIMALKLGQSPL